MTDRPAISPVPIHGHCEPRFARVREAFEKNFEVEDEYGASFTASVNGEVVVDLWAGHADAARKRPWERDTITTIFSTTKAMTAVCAHVLAGRGELDFEAPVAKYWPEFAQAGKERLPVKYIISHQAGLLGWLKPLTLEQLYDWDLSTSRLAEQAPLWDPGTKSGYHAVSYGHLVGEVIRRISGRSPGRFFREEVAGPLGADLHIGLPESEEGRVAEMVSRSMPLVDRSAIDMNDPINVARTTPAIVPGDANTRAWRAAEIPAANGQGNARSCARVMAALACGGSVDGVTLMPESALERAIQTQIEGVDLTLGPMRWGLGFMLNSPSLPLSPNPRTFGHGGWGGSFAMADMDARVGLAYVMNRMEQGTVGDRRLGRLIRALYGAL